MMDYLGIQPKSTLTKEEEEIFDRDFNDVLKSLPEDERNILEPKRAVIKQVICVMKHQRERMNALNRWAQARAIRLAVTGKIKKPKQFKKHKKPSLK